MVNYAMQPCVGALVIAAARCHRVVTQFDFGLVIPGRGRSQRLRNDSLSVTSKL